MSGTRRAGHSVRIAFSLTGAAVLVVLGLVAVVVFRGTFTESKILDAPSTVHELDLLANGHGLIAAPPILAPGQLDSSAWGARFFRTVGVTGLSAQRAVVRASAIAGDDPLWDAFYESTLGAPVSAGASIIGALRSSVTVDTSDRNAVATAVLRMWAGIAGLSSARIPAGLRTSLARWLSARLRACDGNTFVGYYAEAALALLASSLRPDWSRDFTRCDYSAMPTTGTAPSNEVALLTAFAAAEWRARLPTSRVVRAQQQVLRSMLAPQGSMAYDPWWASYAASGFVAAGGTASAYWDIAQVMKSHATPSGLLPESTLPVASIDTTYAAVATLTDLGAAVPRSLASRGITDPAGLMQGQVWTDDEWAAWGVVMSDLDLQPTDALRATLHTHVTACLSQTVSPTTAHVVGLCRTAAHRFGWSAPVTVAWARWAGSSPDSLVDAVAALQLAPARATVSAAIDRLLRDPSAQSTTALADAVLAARVAGYRLTNDQKRGITSVLLARTAAEPFAGFVCDASGQINPSLDATQLVADIDRGNLLADS